MYNGKEGLNVKAGDDVSREYQWKAVKQQKSLRKWEIKNQI